MTRDEALARIQKQENPERYKLTFFKDNVQVPDIYSNWWDDLSQVPPALVTREDNMEVRMLLIQEVGVQNYIRYLKPKILDSRPEYSYELYSVDLSNGQDTLKEFKDCRFLKMVCPSDNQLHIEEVNEDCKTVQDAIDFRRWGADYRKFQAMGLSWNPYLLT